LELRVQECHVLHGQFHVLEIIHLEPLQADHVHHKVPAEDRVAEDRVAEDRVMEDRECQDQDLVQCVQVLQHVHNKDQMQDNDHKVLVEDLVEHHLLLHHIELKVEAHHVPDKVPAVHKDPAADSAHHVLAKAHVLVQVAHLEKVAVRKRITKARKLVAKKSTTCKHPPLVVQLFHAVMEIRQFVYVAVHLWPTSQKKLVQIPRH
jgi:hypothetical protein